MKIDILTLFPNMFEGFKDESIIGRAIKTKKVDIKINNLRDYTDDKHKHVDDTPYGGGAGMVLKCEPVFNAIDKLKKENSKVLLLSPQGIPFTQRLAKKLSKENHLIMICGHYEGFDERIVSLSDMEISIGDYILTGGELPSMVITDAITRLLPGVIEKESYEKESFEENLLDYPTYTKPRNFNGMEVPDVLLSGNHKKINEWRKEEAKKNTIKKRPDLLAHKKISLKNDFIKEINESDYIKKEEKKRKQVGNYSLIEDENTKKAREFNISSRYNVMPKKKFDRKDLADISKVVLIEPTFVETIAKRNLNKKLDILLKQARIVLNDETDDEGSAYVLGELDRLESIMLKNYAKYLGTDYINLMKRKINLLRNEIQLKEMLKIETIDLEKKGRHR